MPYFKHCFVYAVHQQQKRQNSYWHFHYDVDVRLNDTLRKILYVKNIAVKTKRVANWQPVVLNTVLTINPLLFQFL